MHSPQSCFILEVNSEHTTLTQRHRKPDKRSRCREALRVIGCRGGTFFEEIPSPLDRSGQREMNTLDQKNLRCFRVFARHNSHEFCDGEAGTLFSSAGLRRIDPRYSSGMAFSVSRRCNDEAMPQVTPSQTFG